MALANGMMSVGIAIGFITYHLGRARARIGNAGGLGGVSIYHDQRTEQTRTEQNRTGLEDQMIQTSGIAGIGSGFGFWVLCVYEQLEWTPTSTSYMHMYIDSPPSIIIMIPAFKLQDSKGARWVTARR